MKQCDMCFQSKETLVSVIPKMPAMVCKACSYKIQQAIGFITYHQGAVIYQPLLSKEPPSTPPQIFEENNAETRSKSKATNKDKHP